MRFFCVCGFMYGKRLAPARALSLSKKTSTPRARSFA
jgi:hypothetical protein